MSSPVAEAPAPDAAPITPPAVPPLGGAVPTPETPAAAPPAAPETPSAPLPKGWHESILGPDGKFVDAWQDQLPDEFAEDRAMLGRFGDLKTLVKAFKDNMAAARAKTDGLVKVPAPDAPAEERAAFYKSLGVPDDPQGYGIKQPEKMPDGVSWDQNLSDSFASVAHQIGLTPAQVAKMQEWQLGTVGEQVAQSRQSAAQQLEQEKAELNKTFGSNLPKAVDLAQRVAKQEGLSPEIFDPQSPNFWGVEALAFASRVASKLGEDRLIPGAAVRNLSGAALGKDIATNKENPYYSRYHAGDPEIAAMVRDLYKQG